MSARRVQIEQALLRGDADQRRGDALRRRPRAVARVDAEPGPIALGDDLAVLDDDHGGGDHALGARRSSCRRRRAPAPVRARDSVRRDRRREARRDRPRETGDRQHRVAARTERRAGAEYRPVSTAAAGPCSPWCRGRPRSARSVPETSARRHDAALLVDHRIGIAEPFDVDQLDLLDIVQRPAGEEVRRAGEQRAIAGGDQRLLVVGDAGRALVGRRCKRRREQREQEAREGEVMFHAHPQETICHRAHREHREYNECDSHLPVWRPGHANELLTFLCDLSALGGCFGG